MLEGLVDERGRLNEALQAERQLYSSLVKFHAHPERWESNCAVFPFIPRHMQMPTSYKVGRKRKWTISGIQFVIYFMDSSEPQCLN